MKNFFINILDSLKNNSAGYSQRKMAIASILTTVLIANITYIVNCYIRTKSSSIR